MWTTKIYVELGNVLVDVGKKQLFSKLLYWNEQEVWIQKLYSCTFQNTFKLFAEFYIFLPKWQHWSFLAAIPVLPPNPE